MKGVYFETEHRKKPHRNIKRDSLLIVQICPSPKYPGLHEHLYDPSVLLHTALALQLCVSVAHSSMSEKKLIIFDGGTILQRMIFIWALKVTHNLLVFVLPCDWFKYSSHTLNETYQNQLQLNHSPFPGLQSWRMLGPYRGKEGQSRQ